MKIAIAGFGLEGKSNYTYFTKQGHDVTILDERSQLTDIPATAKTILGPDAFTQLGVFDMVVRSPSVPPKKLSEARKTWSATNEFLTHCPAPVIGVTGTKGKGTTSSLIASILQKAGKTVHLVGNIGKPALDTLSDIAKDHIVVYEMSSFQLWDVEKSPHVAVVLMIEPDHLDVHASFDEYVASKQNITRFQNENDLLVYAATNSYSVSIAETSKAQKIGVPSQESAHIEDEYFWYGTEKLCPLSSLRLPGVHNQANACAAIAAAWQHAHDAAAIQNGLSDFSGLPHRLKYVRTVDGVDYYDDSIATTVGSAIAAINAFNQPKILILGGSSKGVVDFREVAEAAARHNVKKALLIGEQANMIAKDLEEAGVIYENLGSAISMPEIVARAHAAASHGDVVILSPACASFGMFKGYVDRGNQFQLAVNNL